MRRIHLWVVVLVVSAWLGGACGGGGAPSASAPAGGASKPQAAASAPAAPSSAPGAAVGSAPAVAAPAPRAPLQKLTLPYSPVEASSTPLWVGVEEKLFERHGLEVELQFVGGSSAILQAMMGGQFDVGGVGGGDVAPLRTAGGDVVMVGTYMPIFSQEGTVRPEIQTVVGLRDKVLGVTRLGASSHYAAIAMLASGGLRSDDATMIQTGGVGESLAALLSGNIDGAMLGFPQNLEARKAGYRRLVSFQELGDYGLFPQNVIGVRESWLREPANRALTLQFLRGLADGLTLAKTGGPEARAAVQKYTKVDDEAVLQSTVEFYREFFPTNLRMPEKSIVNMLQLLALDHPEVRTLDPRVLYDNSLVDEVLGTPRPQ
jgi:ABC-type nitrate/sulfonate/bicarbonate transport system substrate-binding protein